MVLNSYREIIEDDFCLLIIFEFQFKIILIYHLFDFP